MFIKPLPFTQEEAKSIWDFDPCTGNLIWKQMPQKQGARHDIVGRVAGKPSTKGVELHYKKRAFLAHRIIWLWIYGENPMTNVVHLNGDINDNRPENLYLEILKGDTLPTVEVFQEFFEYDPATGLLSRKKKSSKYSGFDTDSQAGYTNRGYIKINFLGKAYFVHRLAWLLYYGSWPENEIDHINHNTSDNRITNLRDVTRSGNQQNRITASRISKTGLLGSSRKKGTDIYIAQITINNEKIHIAYRPTPEEAHEEYVKAKRKLHPFGTL